MALTDSFPGPNGLTDSIEAGKDLAALVAHNPDGTPRAGLLTHVAPLVTGRPDLRVDIALFKAALVRNGAVRLIANDATDQSPAFVLPSANSRIDILYVKVNEMSQGDATDGPVFGIKEGDPAPIPLKPVLNIDGALELATVKVSASDTGTSGANVITQTAPITSAAGGSWASDWRQNDLTNVAVKNRTQSGIGKIQGNNTNQLTEQVNFPVAFSDIPVVFVSYIGYRPTGAHNPSGVTAGSAQRTSPMLVTPSGFRAYINSDGALASVSDFYYQWVAIGAV